jgi:ligand-binding SRPBCC domain-containing protein
VIRPPTLIVDDATTGPFAAWRHEHRFAALDEHHTTLTDRIEYRLGFGGPGRLVDRLVLERLLRRSFATARREPRAPRTAARAPGHHQRS